jgi:hypothetical protein
VWATFIKDLDKVPMDGAAVGGQLWTVLAGLLLLDAVQRVLTLFIVYDLVDVDSGNRVGVLIAMVALVTVADLVRFAFLFDKDSF